MTKPSPIVTAADVREYFRADAKRLESLDAAAKATVAEGARGRLHPQAITRYNAKRRQNRRYVLGATKAAKAHRASQRDSLREAGIEVGARGRLSAEAKQYLAKPKG